jgi:hypothetical protein
MVFEGNDKKHCNSRWPLWSLAGSSTGGDDEAVGLGKLRSSISMIGYGWLWAI